MSLVVLTGAAMALAGVALLCWMILRARRLRARKPGAEGTQAELNALIAMNAAGVALGFLGVGVLVVGLLI